MLLKQTTAEAIARGEVTAVFRRWPRPRVRAGATFRTGAGVVEVTRVQTARLDALTDADARKAGYAGRADLVKELARYPGGRLYRIGVRAAGPDPRVRLRTQARLSPSERERLAERLDRMGARSPGGSWARPVLRLIAQRPAVRAAELARALGMDTPRFKIRVRRLKELGLTESLGTGYRLSPRGRAFLAGPGGRGDRGGRTRGQDRRSAKGAEGKRR